jgi:hypothetical protein
MSQCRKFRAGSDTFSLLTVKVVGARMVSGIVAERRETDINDW